MDYFCVPERNTKDQKENTIRRRIDPIHPSLSLDSRSVPFKGIITLLFKSDLFRFGPDREEQENKQTIMELGTYALTITNLIVQDIKVTKLWNGFAVLGDEVNSYRPQLSEIIFEMIGVEKNEKGEELKDWYFSQTDKACQLDITDNTSIYKLAGEIFLGISFRPGRGKITSSAPNAEKQ